MNITYRHDVSPSDPRMKSMLIMAGANRRSAEVSPDSSDGLLTAYEMSDIDLRNTELVILTACESGLGTTHGYADAGLEEADGGTLFGLRQAVRDAGARGVVMSMWEVPAAESATLMSDFINQWLVVGSPVRDALHDAQLKALKGARAMRKSGHPFWWSGFVYTGVDVLDEVRSTFRMRGTIKNGHFDGSLYFSSGRAAEPDASKPDASKPDAPKPDALKPDALKPDASKRDAPKRDAPKRDAPKPDAPKP
jgi:hypothetical protein